MNLFSNMEYRKPTTSQMVLLGLLAFCAMVDAPRYLAIAGTTLLGITVLVAAGAVWAIFLIKPVLPPNLLKTVIFMVFFEIYATGTMAWSSTGMDGVQLLVVSIGFLGLMLLSARETFLNLQAGLLCLRALVITSGIAVLLYLYVVTQLPYLGADVDVDYAISPRAFSLYTIIPIAGALGLWRGNHGWSFKSILPLLYAMLTAFMVALSMSRTALVCCLMLFPAAVVLRLNMKSLMLAIGTLIAGGAAFAAAVMAYKPLYDRFFGFDASMKVGGISVNASGRTMIWDLLYRTVGDDWLFGKGMAASEVAIRTATNNFIGQPHNDYLRYYYDTGAVGLSLYLCFVVSFVIRTFNSLRRSVRYQTPDFPLHVAALLAFGGVSFAMLTDNPVCYSFVMLPLAIVMGCSLGAGHGLVEPLPSSFEVVYFEPLTQPLTRDVRSVS